MGTHHDLGGYLLFALTQGLGLLFLLFGLFALHAHLARGRSSRWATAALIRGVTGIVPALMTLDILMPDVDAFIAKAAFECRSWSSRPGARAKRLTLPRSLVSERQSSATKA